MTMIGGRARPHVVVVGGGFAGINAAHALAHSDADITLVDRHNYHTFQPLLYQVGTGYLPPEEVGAALRSVFRHRAWVRDCVPSDMPVPPDFPRGSGP